MHGVFSNRFFTNLALTACAAGAAVTTHLAIGQAPSQKDATFTPDPYYVPVEPSLSAPQDGQREPAWTPPPLKNPGQLGGSIYQSASRSDQPVASNQVRSLQNDIVWEPPSTPIEPGYNPSTMTHSPIPAMTHSAIPPRAPVQAQTVAATSNSIIRQPNGPLNQIVPNEFVPAGGPAAANGNLALARSASLTPTISMSTKPAPPAPKIAPSGYAALPGFKKIGVTKPAVSEFATTAGPSSTVAAKTTIGSGVSSLKSSLAPRKRSSSIAGVGSPSLNDFSPTSRAARVGRRSSAVPTRQALGSAKKRSIDSQTKRSMGSTAKQSFGSSTKPPSAAMQPAPEVTKPADTETFVPTQLLATVGGEPIFMADALLEVNQLIEQHMRDAPDSVKDRERKNLIKRVLPKLVDAKVLYVGAIQDLPEGADIEKIVVEAGKEFDSKALPDLMKRAKIDDLADYDAWLRGMGSSLRKQRDTWARDQLTRYFISEQVNANKEITHQQLLDEYRANEATYRLAAKSKWEQVMVRFDRFKTRDQAREAIAEMGNRLIYGANLSALAKKSSHGFRASDGGQHDWTGKDALVLKEIDKALFDLPIGELSDIIETRDGLHIVRVTDRQEAGMKPFTEAQIEIKKRLKNKFRMEAFESHVAKLRKKVPVKYHSAAAESETYR